MSLLASQPDFEPADPDEGATALYYQPADGSGYRVDFPYFQVRCDMLAELFDPAGQALAVWGCAFGSLVALAVEAGFDAYGFDASPYAIERGGQLLPVADRLFLRDALVKADVSVSAADAGAGRFDVLVTEDMLPCMSDEELAIALPLLRSTCSRALHIVTPVDPWADERGLNSPRINWKTADEWKTVVGADMLYDTTTGEVVGG